MSASAGRMAVVTTRCFPELGGIESHVAEVTRRLAERGYEIEVLTTDRSGELAKVERVDGYVVRRFRAYPRSKDWYFSPGLMMWLARHRYSAVHIQGVHTLVPPLAMLVAILRRLPFALTFHTGGSSSPVRSRLRETQWRLLRPLLRRARILVGVSQFEVDRFDGVIGSDVEPVELIRNGGALPPVRPVEVAAEDVIVSVGRLERYKGHHRAIAALPELRAQRPGARLRILGAGPYESELRALARRLGVEDAVEIAFVEPRDRAAMAHALAAASVVVLLSEYEAHPVAVMEALTVGRPVVVARTSGLAELEDLAWARGVDLNADPSVVAEVIGHQLTEPLLPSPGELPTWETCTEALDDVYRRLGATSATTPTPAQLSEVAASR